MMAIISIQAEHYDALFDKYNVEALCKHYGVALR